MVVAKKTLLKQSVDNMMANSVCFLLQLVGSGVGIDAVEGGCLAHEFLADCCCKRL